MSDNIYKKLQRIRVELCKKNLKKSGRNNFKGFNYYELNDFLPQCNELMLKEGITGIFSMEPDKAFLKLVNSDNPEDIIEFHLPLPNKQIEISGANSVQNIGGTSTYTRRYLYLIAFEIAENDEFDAEDPGKRKPENKTNTMTPEKAGAIVLNFGIHKGKTLKEVYKTDKEYFRKLLEEDCEDAYVKEACRIMFDAMKKRAEELKKNDAKKENK